MPPIPASCAHRPTIGGLVIPAINLRLGDGGVDFRGTHQAVWLRCWRERRCQVCLGPLAPPAGQLATSVVVLGRVAALTELVFVEPPLHGECGVYTSKACPMVAGRMARFPDRPQVSAGPRGKRCFLPRCQCGGWVPHDDVGSHRAGEEVGSWYAAWIDDYQVVHRPDGSVLGGMVALEHVLRVREVSNPREGRVWRTVSMDDVRARYRPPATSVEPDAP